MAFHRRLYNSEQDINNADHHKCSTRASVDISLVDEVVIVSGTPINYWPTEKEIASETPVHSGACALGSEPTLQNEKKTERSVSLLLFKTIN